MFNKIQNILKEKFDLQYLIGLFVCIIVPLIIMSFCYNKGIANFDGWYSLYSDDILNGRIPYIDFHFLMPPCFLYLWTIIHKIFGNYIIVSHVSGVILECIICGTLYYTFCRFFNIKISVIATLFSSMAMLSLPFVNCVFSYNDFVILLGLIGINLFISFTKKLYKENKVSYFYVVLIALFNTILFFTKQSNGVIINLGFFILYTSIVLCKSNKFTYLKSVGIYILTSIVTAFMIFLPILHKDIIGSYIANVFLGTSAKGSLLSMLLRPLQLVSGYQYISPVFFVALICFVIFILNKYSVLNITFMKKEDKSNLIPNIWVIMLNCIMVIAFAYYVNYNLFPKMFLVPYTYGFHYLYYQIGAIAQFVIFFMAVFYFIRFFILQNENDAKKMILYCLFTLTFLATAFSGGDPVCSTFLYGLMFASLLNIKFRLQPVFEILSFLLLLYFVFCTTLTKMVIPFNWWGFQTLNISTERAVPASPFLKGFDISKQENDTYNEINGILDKYLNPDDKIFCFINNLVFYYILNRKPFYDDYYNLYWDVCPDEDAKAIFDMLSTAKNVDRPKAIIYFENPEGVILFHEATFRNGSSDNYQRKIDELLKSFINSQEYIVVSQYDAQSHYEKQNDLWFMMNFTEKDRYFLENGYKLKIMIRNDIFKSKDLK